jgi:uncharacterized protein YidB (DUF937 family)
MLENLINLVKEQAGDPIVNNPAIPNEKNGEAVQEASHSIVSGLQQALQGGNLQDVMHLFSGNTAVADNPVTQNIQGGFVQNLMHKFGLDAAQAGSIASNLIPGVLQKLVHKTNDPNDSSFDLQGILNGLSGGKTSGFDVQGLLNKFKGGMDKNGDGNVDLQDLQSLFQGGGEGGGLMDKVKGLFN